MTRTTRVLTGKERLADAWITLKSGPIIRTNAQLGRHFRFRMTEAATLEPPYGASSGRRIIWRVEQGATGYALTPNGFTIVGDFPSDYADITAGAVTFLEAVYDDESASWELRGLPELSGLLDTLGTAQHGTILFRGDSSWQMLDPGSVGQRLTSNGPGANPTWETP